MDRNVYYSRRGWTPPDIPMAYQISKQDLVILMTVCSQVRFLVIGQTNEYGHLGPADVASAITQDILDIEGVIMQGKTRGPPPDSIASVPKVVVSKKGAHSPIEDVVKEEKAPHPTPKMGQEGEGEDEDEDGSCVIY